MWPYVIVSSNNIRGPVSDHCGGGADDDDAGPPICVEEGARRLLGLP